ncbi:adenylate/guanylate cyclase domain-containing protein [Nocardioides sp. GCM10030258]|uniref:adenylate/guanylate cyclase domain-containing protein n=1 Tax=unclassified Nocardioides TaxID=2615069 RepID=UPI003605E730
MDGAQAPARHGLLGRFDAPIEAAYQTWYIERFRPLGIAMAAASVVAWIINPLIVTAYLETDHVVATFLVSWAVNIPALLAGIVYLRRPEPKWAIAFATGLLMLTAANTIAVLLPWIPGLKPMAFALAATFFGLLAPLVQLPFRLTLLTGLLITTAGELGLFLATDRTGQDVAISLTFIPISSLLVGPAMAFANERDLRARYVRELLIQHQRQLIRRYAPGSVVSRIELGDSSIDHPQRRRITILSSDVVGFTAMADRIDPEALAHIINDYLGAVSDLIERHGGTVTEFAGDGVMAIFGAPDEIDPVDQVRSAIAAAQELQRSLVDWSRAWYAHGIVEAANARIGINTGVVSVGTFGSAIRATYTGIGLQMNIAARVQAQAEPGGILLSNTSWHLVKDAVDCEARGEVFVKGVHFPIELYSPVAG